MQNTQPNWPAQNHAALYRAAQNPTAGWCAARMCSSPRRKGEPPHNLTDLDQTLQHTTELQGFVQVD